MNGIRIGGWSGPRNISTALMRAWSSRADTLVCDEPLYAYYLATTGRRHPMADEVIAAHETDLDRVIATLTGPILPGKRIFYQKHMAQHLLDGVPLDWIAQLRNFLLIRDPAEVLLSFSMTIPDVDAGGTGLPHQMRLFEWLTERTGTPPPVIDARDVLEDPAGMLAALCDALGAPFDQAMLSWPRGRQPTDGVWASAWYRSVEESTGFQPYRPKTDELSPRLAAIHDEVRPLYETLHAARLRA
jgi:hypothetical protein